MTGAGRIAEAWEPTDHPRTKEGRFVAKVKADGEVVLPHDRYGKPGEVSIGTVRRHAANPRYWEGVTHEDYVVPSDGRTRKEAVEDLVASYRAGVAPGKPRR